MITNKQALSITISSSIVFGIIILLIFNLLDPNDLTPFGLLLIFIAIYLEAGLVILLLYLLFTNIINYLISSRPVNKISFKEIIKPFIIGFLPIYVVSIQSIRDITAYEVGLVVIMILLVVFYIKKR